MDNIKQIKSEWQLAFSYLPFGINNPALISVSARVRFQVCIVVKMSLIWPLCASGNWELWRFARNAVLWAVSVQKHLPFLLYVDYTSSVFYVEYVFRTFVIHCTAVNFTTPAIHFPLPYSTPSAEISLIIRWPEGRRSMFLLNVAICPQIHMALLSRRPTLTGRCYLTDYIPVLWTESGDILYYD